MANNYLLLLSGNDIPFPLAQITIHTPKIKEIAYVGETPFFSGCELIKFSKDNLSQEDKVRLSNCTNFDVIMIAIGDKTINAIQSKQNLLSVLQLLFPDYDISIQSKENVISLKRGEEEIHYLDNSNFEAFKQIIIQLFCLQDKGEAGAYNPSGKMARELAEKFKKAKQKISQGKSAEINILEQYVSILAVGEQKDMNELMNYSVYQLFDEFERFEMKENFDSYAKAKMFGAKDLKEVEHWMKNTKIQ